MFAKNKEDYVRDGAGGLCVSYNIGFMYVNEKLRSSRRSSTNVNMKENGNRDGNIVGGDKNNRNTGSK